MIRLPPRSTQTDTLFPNTSLFPSFILCLLGIAIAGGMFVVPLYAFLTTTVAKSQTARTVAANNIVNSGFMVAATLVLSLLIGLGLTIDDTRSEEHTSELQSLMRISYAVFCLKKQ